MRLTSVSITNMALFEKYETKLPVIALIQGKNRQGKSSLLDCTKYAFGRGHNEDLIHGNAPEGEILIEFDDGAAVKCRAVRDKHETTRSWRAPGSKKFVVSREQIDAIANAISYNPLSFLDMSEKEQLETLLRIMPIEVSDQEIQNALGGVVVDTEVRTNALDHIDGLRKVIYDTRRDRNSAADTQTKHAAELEKSLPPAAPGTDWNAESLRLQAEKERIETHQAERIRAIGQLFDQEKEAAAKEYQNRVELAAQIRDKRIEDARGQANIAGKKVKADDAVVLEKLVTELATAQERSRSIAQAEGTRKAIASAQQSAKENREESAKFTAALERLDKLKEAVALRLPIKGVKVENGRIFREENGQQVPFPRWNTESQLAFCLRVAVLAHGQAGFICVDDAEHLDSEKRTKLVEAAQKYAESDGLQFLIASVSDTPLTVTAPG